jgi:hypothetical protein
MPAEPSILNVDSSRPNQAAGQDKQRRNHEQAVAQPSRRIEEPVAAAASHCDSRAGPDRGGRNRGKCGHDVPVLRQLSFLFGFKGTPAARHPPGPGRGSDARTRSHRGDGETGERVPP